MKFCTNFIMVGSHDTSKASESSTVKQIEKVLTEMYQSVEDTKLKLSSDQKTHLLEECSFSTHYAQF